MFFRRHTAILAGAGLLALAGCFNEPEPAYKTRPEGAEIRLQDRGISSLDVKLDPAIVVYVNLDRNEFREVPQEILACTKLKWLRLNGNRLESLPDLGGLKDLRRIYLKNNKFAAVPEALKALDNLTDLELSGNPITEVPGWLTEMKSLKNVSLNRTRIEKLPDDLSGWRGLTSLQLGDLRIPAEEMARIRQALPEVAIVF